MKTKLILSISLCVFCASAQVRRLGSYTPAPRQTLSCIGDSLTLSAEGFGDYLQYPTVLAGILSSNGAAFRGRNFGVSGETSTQNLARQACLTNYDIPAIAVIWTGFNDPGNSIVSATTVSNIQTMVTNLISVGCPRIVVCTRHYENWSGADNGAANPTAGDIWYAGNQAGTNMAAIYPGKVAMCDLYHWFYALLQSNPSWVNQWQIWHVGWSGNVHLNAYGQSQVAAALYSSITNAGWLPSLQAVR